jgi:translation initiation factor 2B subunit (eIF-2B alpha/beta/delta family)
MRIEDDNLSGAALLTKQALQRIGELTEGSYSSRHAFLTSLREESTHLSESQKSMVSIRNLLFRVCAVAEKGETLAEAIHLARESITTQLNTLRKAESSLITHGCSLFHQGMQVLTHSRSSAVEKILISAYGKTPFDLIITESRPNNEGHLLAESLAEQGIPVTLIVDAAAGKFHPDMVLVGADAVTPSHVVNKIGTRLLAAQFPLYIACTTQKFTSGEVEIAEEDPREVLSHAHPKITVKNYYFDKTPLHMVTGFVTEHGICSAEEVRTLL